MKEGRLVAYASAVDLATDGGHTERAAHLHHVLSGLRAEEVPTVWHMGRDSSQRLLGVA